MTKYLVTRTWTEVVEYAQSAVFESNSEEEAINLAELDVDNKFGEDEPTMVDAREETSYEYEAELND